MTAAKKLDPRSDYVRRLHLAYSRRSLNVFVGAGSSQQSGFPGWDTFNKALLRNYLLKDIGDATPAAMLAAANIDVAADDLYSTLGRDAAADFVHHGTRNAFGKALAKAFYGTRTLADLPIKSVHHQIAALADKARLFTLNFDPLIELAFTRTFPKKNWIDFRSPDENGESVKGKYKVEHLHGWLDPDGVMSEELVLTQSKYFDLSAKPNAPANRILKRILAGDKATLILGMSLADPNFRRMLHFLNKERISARRRIFVLMKRENPAVDHYMQVHWGSSGLQLLFIEHYDEIPGLLRDIQWGEASENQIPKWVNAAIDWRWKTLPDKAIFSNLWQEIAYESLRALIEQIRALFAVAPHETINVALFVPFWESKNNASLRMIATSRKAVSSDGALFRATRRVLQIKKRHEQGIAGVCFSSGTVRSVEFGEGQMDINFTADMTNEWVSEQGYRDWRSILAVPVIDGRSWVPVAVLTLTSNMPIPFWSQFGNKRNLLEPELHAAMRQVAHFCLAGFASTKV